MSALGLALAATRPRAERPWWLRRPGMLAIGALVLFATALGGLSQPEDAQAVGLPDLNPAHWAVKGFVAILIFLFGDELRHLAGGLLDFLLRTPDVTDRSVRGGFAQLNRLLRHRPGRRLGVAVAVVHRCGRCSTGRAPTPPTGPTPRPAPSAARSAAIGMLVSLPVALHLVIGAMNALTDGLIHNSVVGRRLGHDARRPRSRVGLSNGGLALFVGVAALVAVLLLLITKIVTAALLAVLYILAPLAIGLWPFEPLAWALKTLASAALALLVFPVVWAASFGVFAVCSSSSLAAGVDLGAGLLTSIVGLTALIIAFKLPFAVLRLGMGAGLLPSASRGLQTMYYARSAAAALA